MKTNFNLAWIVYRMVTSHRGVRVDEIRSHLGISGRTYRSYRLQLQREFPLLKRPDGSSCVEEVSEGSVKYLRIVDLPDNAWSDADFIARVAALHFARRLLNFFEGTEVADAISAFLSDFEHRMKDRKYLLGETLRHADRMFYEIPDAPKDYSDKRLEVQTILRAMLLTRQIEVEYDSASLKGPWGMVLQPLTLASHRSALYLIARHEDYDDIRMYAVDRFRKVEMTDEKFEYPSRVSYDPESYVASSWGLFRGDDDEQHEFELLFEDKRWLKMFLKERRWHRSQELEELDDGRLRMTFEVSSPKEVWRWIRGFGDDVDVVRPDPPESL